MIGGEGHLSPCSTLWAVWALTGVVQGVRHAGLAGQGSEDAPDRLGERGFEGTGQLGVSQA